MVDHNKGEQREEKATKEHETEIEAEKNPFPKIRKLEPLKAELQEKKEELNRCFSLLNEARTCCEDILPHLKTLEDVKSELSELNTHLLSLPEGFSFPLSSPLLFTRQKLKKKKEKGSPIQRSLTQFIHTYEVKIKSLEDIPKLEIELEALNQTVKNLEDEIKQYEGK